MTKKTSNITINDIANLAGVSKATVSFYLNGRFDKMSAATAQKIGEIIRTTGYRPSMIARSLNDKHTKLIGVIIGDITNSFSNRIVKGIDDCAQEKGYQLMLASSNYQAEKEISCISSMMQMGVDGFIVQPTIEFDDFWFDSGIDKPIVFFDSPTASNGLPWVKTNNYEAVFETVETLAEKGYEEFVMITADPKVLRTRMERNKGFSDALIVRDLPSEVLIFGTNTSSQEIEASLQKYLNRDRRTCIFVCNNWLLDKTYLALREYYDLIPDHLGLIGFDSLEWSELAVPSISTIVQPAYEEGKASASILIDLIEGKHETAPNQILSCYTNYLESTNLKK